MILHEIIKCLIYKRLGTLNLQNIDSSCNGSGMNWCADISFVRVQNNAITASGYEPQVLYGTSLLSAFRQYDKNARLAN